jgi:hypothetical protein
VPIEDFTTYTEVDVAGYITVTAPEVTVANQPTIDGDTWIYSDEGVGFFSGDFTHQWQSTYSLVNDTTVYYSHALSNLLDDITSIRNAAGESLCSVRFVADNVGAGQKHCQILIEDPNLQFDATGFILVSDTEYFFTLVRDDDGGGSSSGRYTLSIRTGSHTGVLIDTLIADTTAKLDFRYLFGTIASGVGGANTVFGNTKNLNINTVVDVTPTSSVWSNPSGIVSVSQTGPFSVTPLGSVWDNPSSIPTVVFLATREGRKNFDAVVKKFLNPAFKKQFFSKARKNQ